MVISPKFGYLDVIWWLGRESLSKLSSLELNWRFGKKYTSPRFPGRASLCLVHPLDVGAKWFSFKAGLKKIDMSDNILISRKTTDSWDILGIFWKLNPKISPKKHPKCSVFQGGFTRGFWKIPSTVNFPHAAFPYVSWPASHRWTNPSETPTRHWPYAEDDRLCGGAYNCGPLGF